MQQVFEFIINNWALCLAFIALLGMLVYVEMNDSVAGIRMLSSQQLTQLVNHEQAVIVDLREPSEFKAGHIASAISLPQDTLEKRINKLQKHKSKPIILYCKNGQQAPNTGATLRKAGFEKVFALKGGLQAWQSANLPLVNH